MDAALDHARRLVLRAAWMKDRGIANTREASAAKAYGPPVAERVIRRAIQIMGPDGASEKLPGREVASRREDLRHLRGLGAGHAHHDQPRADGRGRRARLSGRREEERMSDPQTATSTTTRGAGCSACSARRSSTPRCSPPSASASSIARGSTSATSPRSTEPGDFRMRELGARRIVFVRGKDRVVRALLNSCTHRGAEVCRERSGNANSFQCFYHGWTYRRTTAA